VQVEARLGYLRRKIDFELSANEEARVVIYATLMNWTVKLEDIRPAGR
jgi:hypothetical protein